MCNPFGAGDPGQTIRHQTRICRQSGTFKIPKCSSEQLCIVFFLLCCFTVGNYAEASNITSQGETTDKTRQVVQCFGDGCFVKIFSSQQGLKNMVEVSEYLFNSYAITNGSQKFIDYHGIEKFISDVGLIKEDQGHDHDHDHHHNHDPDYWADIMADYFDDEDSDNGNETTSRKRRSEEDGEFPCFSSVEELVAVYFGLSGSEGVQLTIGDFVALMPRVLLDLTRPDCRFQDDSHSHHDHDHGDEDEDIGIEHNKTNTWLFSLGSVFVVSLVSLVSVLLVPLFHKSKMFNHLIGFLVALAVGTLIGDALLHLLPHASGLHDHSEHGHEGHDHDHHGHEEEDDHFASVWKGLVACGGIYVFFLLETIMGFCAQKKKRLAQNSSDVESPLSPAEQERKLDEDHEEKPKVETVEPLDYGHHHHHCHKVPQTIASLAWMVILGDGLHNITDGLAIGAAFTSSIGTGLGTVLAIFFHEIPKKLGDFAVLLESGMTVKQALLWNFISALMSFVGLAIGLLIGEYTNGIIVWVLAFTAGVFLYIALVDMLPAVMKQCKGKGRLKRFVIQNIGLLSGFAIMVLIALKEEEIAHTF